MVTTPTTYNSSRRQPAAPRWQNINSGAANMSRPDLGSTLPSSLSPQDAYPPIISSFWVTHTDDGTGEVAEKVEGSMETDDDVLEVMMSKQYISPSHSHPHLPLGTNHNYWLLTSTLTALQPSSCQ